MYFSFFFYKKKEHQDVFILLDNANFILLITFQKEINKRIPITIKNKSSK